jgi:hypothetical protein
MAQQHPRFPDGPGPSQSVTHIFAIVALECDAADSRLLALYLAEMKRKNFSGQTEKTRALWEAFIAVREKANTNFVQAKKYGQLLYAFHGTKAFTSAKVAA